MLLTSALGLSNPGAQGRGVPGGVTFYSVRDGNAEIYTMDWDGGHQTRVTGHPATDADPANSPNGRDIMFTSHRGVVFHSNRGRNFEIYVMDADGLFPTWLTDYAGIDQFRTGRPMAGRSSPTRPRHPCVGARHR